MTAPPRAPRALLATLLVAAACNLTLRPEGKAVPDGGTGATANGIGTPCSADTGCRAGLTCSPMTKTCQAAGNRPAGGGCSLTAECMAPNYCTPAAVCGPRAGSMPAGGKCTLEGDCAPGLLCNYQGLSGTCAPAGTGDLGATCSKATDCMGGLICSLGKCQTFENIEPWAGAVCPEPSPMAGARVLFKIPRASDRGEDFYALPYPNDIRKNGGKLSLSGHPSPGPRYLPFDPVQSYLTLAAEDLTGYGLNPTIYFRFTRNPKVETAQASGVVTLVNITPTSPEYGRSRELLPPEVRTGKGFYVCAPYLIVHPKWGEPLRPGETYAAVIRRGITDEAGAMFERDDDFGKLLQPSAGDPELAAASTAYAPLRAWIAAQDQSQIVAAAVFTTQRAEDSILGLRLAARDGAAPAIKGLVKCGDPGARSPCDDGKTGADHLRGCGAASTAYDEYQGTVAIPIYQAGKKPYESAADGGGIVFDASGKAMAAGSEDVCFTLTVPKSAAPTGGWPVVVYAHGTGGSYTSVVDNDLAEEYARGELAGGAAQPMATFGYDGALHANRRGGSERSPDELVYNFVNARGARDTTLQAAADLFVVARALETFAAVKVDPAKIMVYGHSQGGNAAALAVPYEPLFAASVMSGTGGTLTFSLLAKKKPVDVAAGIPLLLGDPKVDEFHPILNVLQMYFDRSDGVNFGRRLFKEPPPMVKAHSVLHVFGTEDTYSPVQTQRTYALSAGFPVLLPVIDDHKLMSVMAPVRGNVMVGGATVTAVQAQFAPSGYDGHFVSTQNSTARRLIQQMLGTFARDGQPTVGP